MRLENSHYRALIIALGAQENFVGVHKHPVPGKERTLIYRRQQRPVPWAATKSTYNVVDIVRLAMMDGLEFVKLGLGGCEIQTRRFGHETELGIEVVFLFLAGEGMPEFLLDSVRGPLLNAPLVRKEALD